jgi:3-oxoacyl-[acyl-carrier-protein] synthase II
MSRRVVVTGLGIISSLGHDVVSFWDGLCAGRSGVSFIDDFPTEKLRSDINAKVRDFDPSALFTRKETEIYGRGVQMSLCAAAEALDHAGLGAFLKEGMPGHEERADMTRPQVDETRIGCLMSTGQGSVDIFEQQIEKSRVRGPRAVSPFFIPGVMPNSAAALITMRYGFMGPSYSLASACATGTHSITTSALMITAGEADVMIAGGAEAATRLNTVAGFGNARALTKAWDGDPTKASRPFDAQRRGFVMGEGAGALILEELEHARARGATVLAEVAGWGMSSDAQHLTSPHAEGKGLRLAVERALSRAGITAADIDYINPHATSTKLGDLAEIKALEQVFGDRLSEIPISATKSMVGHMLGGAGAAESIASVCTLRDQRIHPSINLDELDDAFQLNVVTEATDRAVRHVLKVSAGFGGHNCALVFARV